MSLKSKRPISVWIAQILLAIYGGGTALIVLWGLYVGLTDGIPNPELYLFTNIGILTMGAIFLGGLWGMGVRKAWGRWLGVVGLLILLIATSITQVSRFLSGIDNESGFLSIGLFFRVLLLLGMVVLVYKVAAGDAEDEFFGGVSSKVRGSADG